MAAASSSSDIIPRGKYDVFLSFRGKDTRDTFTSYLYAALCDKKILTYKDDEELQRGDDIPPALLKAISESKLSVIIFSEDYASSKWCLNELVHILRCRGEQFVIPIFYGVDPSHVGKQLESDTHAFVQHEERFKDEVRRRRNDLKTAANISGFDSQTIRPDWNRFWDEVLRWRNALKTAAKISGFNSQTIRPDSDLVKRVVDDILVKLDGKSQNAGGLERWVGMDKHIIQLVELLCLNSRDVQIVGIWGMGGIGKTTIADVVFHRLSFEFEACCFIKDVREKASETKDGLPYDLRNDLFRTLLKDEKIRIDTPSIGSTFMRDRLGRTKALIVLDDVSEFSQLEFFAGGDFNLFDPGSRILVTTRNKRIFRNGDEIYEVKKLDVDEALELFHSRANISSPGDYTTFAKQVVDYAGGNPLALTILGGVFYHCKSKVDWEGELRNLKNYPNKRIQSVLRFSYDGLGENERGIFLDIACYYKGEHIGNAERMLDASGFCANAGIRLLIDMSLISINSHFSTVEMHDLIQETGQTIVESNKDPGQRSRLWIAEDVIYVLEHETGTQAIECIVSMGHISELDIEPSAFKKMHNLRLLKLQFERYSYWESRVQLPRGLEWLPRALRILQWDGYPLNSLPSKFRPDNLVELRMCKSRLERLWDKGLKINLGSLKRIDLTYSKHLAEVPDLSESPNLESIILERCTSLIQLPSSFQHLAKLTRLNLNFCSNLKILPEMPGNLETLELRRTAIEELPSSIWSLEKLRYLRIEECEKLKTLPSSTCRLNSLEYLNLYGCLSLESLPVELPAGLRTLDLRDCESLAEVPDLSESPNLERIRLGGCTSLVQLPSSFQHLAKLTLLNLEHCSNLKILPEMPGNLESLYLDGTAIEELPSSIWCLEKLNELVLGGCEKLKTLPSSTCRLNSLQYLNLYGCLSLESLPVELPAGLRTLDLRDCESLASLPVELPAGLNELYLGNCKSLGSLPKLPWLLKGLDANGCTSLETVSSSMRTAPIQGRDQYVNNSEQLWPEGGEQLSFINCVKLDQSARSNIMADAQLRVMQFATASRLGHELGMINIVCPGNEIPKWMRYQSEGCSINIKLPPHSFRQGFLGYALCIVLAFNNYMHCGPYFSCDIHYRTNNGDEGCWNAFIRNWLPDILINSDHVFVWYFHPEYDRPGSTINREDWVKASEASFDFMLYQSNYVEKIPFDLSTVRVKRCGVSLLYAQDFEKLVEGIDEDVVMEPEQVVRTSS